MDDFQDTNIVRREDGAYDLRHTKEPLPTFCLASQKFSIVIGWKVAKHTMEISIKPEEGLKIYGAKIRIRNVEPGIVTDDNGKTWRMENYARFVAQQEPYTGILSVVETERGLELRFQVMTPSAPDGDSLPHLFLQS